MNGNQSRTILYGNSPILLIDIDTETHQTLVWSGRQMRAVIATDLIGIFQESESNFHSMEK
jgi:hypothetical protein